MLLFVSPSPAGIAERGFVGCASCGESISPWSIFQSEGGLRDLVNGNASGQLDGMGNSIDQRKCEEEG